MSNRLPNLTPDLQPISFLVWNTQGTGNRPFLSALKEVIRVNRPSVVALVETHMDGNHARVVASTIGFDGHLRVDAQGFSGGIWVYWKPNLVTIDDINQSPQHITMQISRTGLEPWYFTAVYASPDPIKRQDLWDFLKEFAKSHNMPWMLGGDFNDTRFDWERNSCSSETHRRARRFNHWIESMELIELEFAGPQHTWSRGLTKETRRSARLDRALCNGLWTTRFSQACRRILRLQSS
ncbi:Ribonuclease H [Bienertia sinuspersici]